MTIQKPIIKTDRDGMLEHRTIAFNFFNEYNINKGLKDQLRESHMSLYFLMVEVASHQLEVDNAEVDTSRGFSIQGAPGPYSKILRCDVKAISRRFARLEEAGVITTHPDMFKSLLGRERIVTNKIKEILINPDFLLIYDKSDPNYIPTSSYRTMQELPDMTKERYKMVSGSSVNLEYRDNYSDFIINK
ncbi:hypothetical protein [Saccharicrinis sp. GN24d3]|uniref:hypothetical protein n=1 Tax=Saccharicrinis sp. GN24d3 TaxID=3458416 RepID=UPI0040374691